jgi:hypothetical protein
MPVRTDPRRVLLEPTGPCSHAELPLVAFVAPFQNTAHGVLPAVLDLCKDLKYCMGTVTVARLPAEGPTIACNLARTEEETMFRAEELLLAA